MKGGSENGRPFDPSDLLRASGLLVRAVEPLRRRRNAAGSEITVVEIEDLSGARALAYLKTSALAEEAARTAAKWTKLEPAPSPFGGPGVMLLNDGRTLLFFFPNDGELRSLKAVADFDKLKRLLAAEPGPFAPPWRVKAHGSSARLLRWKPEHRYVARLELSLRNDEDGAKARLAAIARLAADDRGRRTATLLRKILAADPAAPVPEPLAVLLDGKLYIERAVLGPTWQEELGHSTARAEAVAEALAMLHGVLGWGGFVHGDLHPGQILLAPEGPVFVDFERAGSGDPLDDAADLHYALLGLEAGADPLIRALPGNAESFLEAYAGALDPVRRSGLGAALARAATRWLEIAARKEEAAVSRGAADAWRGARERVRAATTSRPQSSRSVSTRPPLLDRVVASGLTIEAIFPRPGDPNGKWPARATDASGRVVYGELDREQGLFEVIDPRLDAALPGLSTWLDRGRLVAYRPRRRAVVRAMRDGKTVFVKILPPGKASRLHALARALEIREVPSPRLVEFDAATGAVVFEAVEGRTLAAAWEGAGASEPPFGRVAAAVVRLQRTATEGFATGDAVRDALAFQRLSEADGAAPVDPLVFERIAASFASLPSVFAHGDLHEKNLIERPDGEFVFIDLDGASVLPASVDPGNLTAHRLHVLIRRGASADELLGEAESTTAAFCAANCPADSEAIILAAALALARLAAVHRFRAATRAEAPKLGAAFRALIERKGRG